MKCRPLALVALLPWLLAAAPVEVIRFDWHDAARERDVPVKVYYPAKLAELAAVIVFSHGLGGSA